jgi:hypothetical protein
MDTRRTFTTPIKNTFASDYINNKRSKVKYAGTSNLARTVAQQGGMLPLVTPSGQLKPYQGTYGFSSSTSVQGAPPSAYCLNQCRSYRDYLDITKGKYLLTPPNPTTECINTHQVAFIEEIHAGPFLEFSGYKGNANSMVFNKSLVGGVTGPTGAVDKIIYDPTTPANQYINVDPSYNLFYNEGGCLISATSILSHNIKVNQSSAAQRNIDRYLNMNLLNGFNYPSKFALNYNQTDCINSNNDIQPGPYPTCPP